MALTVVRGSTTHPEAAEFLVTALTEENIFTGFLYVGFPIVLSSNKPTPIDALLIDRSCGIVLFDLVEGTEAGEYKRRQDDAYNALEGRLKPHRKLVDGRVLRIDLQTLTVAPACTSPLTAGPSAIVYTSDELLAAIRQMNWEGRDNNVYRFALSALDGGSTFRLGTQRRSCQRNNSLGARLSAINKSVVTFDSTQLMGAIESVEGVQRIRGLAGSGKTIVLARKAAYWHVLHPDWKIGVTFYTRSLKAFFQQLIERFVFDAARCEPDWDKLSILNAWGADGGPDRSGIYYEFCDRNNVTYLDFKAAVSRFGRPHVFDKSCELAMQEAQDIQPYYDALLIDEGQDLPQSFFQLCYHRILRRPKRLVYAYDELQNLTGELMLPPHELFDITPGGTSSNPSLDFSYDDGRHDVVLPKCYRTPRPVLVAAHAIGFGIYREPDRRLGTGLVQMFDDPGLWTTIGYDVVDGTLDENSIIDLCRTEKTSPKYLENHSDIEELIKFKTL